VGGNASLAYTGPHVSIEHDDDQTAKVEALVRRLDSKSTPCKHVTD
jgi:hypothetical protein